jgi:cysteine synthase
MGPFDSVFVVSGGEQFAQPGHPLGRLALDRALAAVQEVGGLLDAEVQLRQTKREQGRDTAPAATGRFHVDRPGGLSAIGNTPVVRLERITDDNSAEIWVKMEAANPTGSYKDRMALAMIEAAEADGRLQPGQTVVEYTGGSTGSSLALVCAVKGYPLRIVSSDAFAPEKIKTMQAFGAEVELIPSPAGITPDLIPAMMKRAAEIAAETGAYATDQFNNTDMVDGYRKLGEEFLEQLAGTLPITAFCSYVGTAGCFLGVSRALTAALPGIHRVVVEPAESAVLSGGPPGTHHIEGGGIGQRPPLLSTTDYDEVIAVPEAEAFAMARRAARTEGIFSGPSTGANLIAALTLARRLGPGHRVVTIQVDSGLKYLAGQST